MDSSGHIEVNAGCKEISKIVKDLPTRVLQIYHAARCSSTLSNGDQNCVSTVWSELDPVSLDAPGRILHQRSDLFTGKERRVIGRGKNCKTFDRAAIASVLSNAITSSGHCPKKPETTKSGFIYSL